VDAREAAGVDQLVLSARLSRRAHEHSQEMAAQGSMFHSCLSCGSGNARMAENVGYGSDLKSVHEALMDSHEHRENILANFDKVGVGVVRKGGTVWVTEVFSS
jgi:uncharacterized protein YkwD